jgi:1-deoxy-D-xylulose-5-phosphate synthase
MVELAREDRRIVAVTAAMPEGTGLSRFADEFPDRFFDVGIAEQHGVTFAAGMATEGLRPVVAIYSTFLQRAYDQILHDVCLEALPVVFAVDRGGIVGEDGPTHHGAFDLAFLRSLPNMVLMAPKDENELRRMLKTALEHDGPIAFRYPRGSAMGVSREIPIRPLKIGKSEILAEGEDLLMLGIGHTVSAVQAAADQLRQKGVQATVVNSRFIKPIDTECIVELASRIPRILTVEENVVQGGFGSAVLEALSDAQIGRFRLRRIGIPDAFVEHGSPSRLRSRYGLDAAGILKAAEKMMALAPVEPS